MKKLLMLGFSVMAMVATSIAQDIRNNPTSNHGNKFEQLGTILPTPNEYRTASGAPGPKYWQQRADYDIKATLDEKNLMLHGAETVTYFNNSPDVLTYIWSDWKQLLILVTAFTIGHSVTLALSVLQWVNFPINLIELLKVKI